MALIYTMTVCSQKNDELSLMDIINFFPPAAGSRGKGAPQLPDVPLPGNRSLMPDMIDEHAGPLPASPIPTTWVRTVGYRIVLLLAYVGLGERVGWHRRLILGLPGCAMWSRPGTLRQVHKTHDICFMGKAKRACQTVCPVHACPKGGGFAAMRRRQRSKRRGYNIPL